MNVPAQLTTWESVATVAVAQTVKASSLWLPTLSQAQYANDDAPSEFLRLSGLYESGQEHHIDEGIALPYDAAYRAVDQGTTPYIHSLAGSPVSSLSLLNTPPTFIMNASRRWLQREERRGIVVAPFGIKPELDLPRPVWTHVIRMLRSYGERVLLVGDCTQRMDTAAFTEDEIMTEHSVADRIAAIQSAKLVVGVANAWTWIAAGVPDTRLAYFYPETIPAKRWFHYSSQYFGRISFHPNQIRIPIVLTGLRTLIGAF